MLAVQNSAEGLFYNNIIAKSTKNSDMKVYNHKKYGLHKMNNKSM